MKSLILFLQLIPSKQGYEKSVQEFATNIMVYVGSENSGLGKAQD